MKSRGRVVHCKKEKFDVYIGRPGQWGNPFAMRSEGERQDVIEKYRIWIIGEIRDGRIKKEDVLRLRGKVLGCWCAPRACHGDVLLDIAEKLQGGEALS